MYIGSSINPRARFVAHLRESRNPQKKSKKSVWIRGLIEQGLEPILEIVQELPMEGIEHVECRLIGFFQERNPNLTNEKFKQAPLSRLARVAANSRQGKRLVKKSDVSQG